MKKNLILSMSFISGVLLQAQNIEESTYIEKDKDMEAFSFSIPVCNKDVLVDVWKTFIKKQGGKVRGGIVNKVNGYDIKFVRGGESWNGYFAYSFNDDNTQTIFVSFQNILGQFINYRIPEKEAVLEALEEFRLDVQKSCTLDDLNNAKNYSISLSKEKIRNSDRIIYLEKSLNNDRLKIELNNGQSQASIDKIKQRIISNEAELQSLENRNIAIEEELEAQNIVIQRFQQRMDELEGGIIPDEDISETNLDDEDITSETEDIVEEE
ncbi:MAG: hypothetical protein LBQ84_07650 [Flavobacteriaceae bacterium]|jgi:hypothetical protein|nr:hypothetical protein [Flavobacteriaceae bacterium]